MSSAKEMAIKLIDEMPESKIDEIIDFMLFIKNKQDFELVVDLEEAEELKVLLDNEERISSDEVKKKLFGI